MLEVYNNSIILRNFANANENDMGQKREMSLSI